MIGVVLAAARRAPRRKTLAALGVAGAATLAIAGCKPVGIGDVNGDTHLDVVGVSWGNGLVAMLNDGAGNLAPGPTLGPVGDDGGCTCPQSIVVGSLRELPTSAPTKDEGVPGHGLDVATLVGSKVSVFVNNGTGAFQNRPFINAGPNPRDMAVGSAGLDSVPDLFVANGGSSGKVSVMQGRDGQVGRYGPRVAYPAGQYPVAIATLNSIDQRVSDVAVSNDSRGVSILKGDAKDPYASRQFVPIPANVLIPGGGATSPQPGRIAVGDINRDGLPDLLVADGAENGRLDLLLGQSTGRFKFAGAIPTPDSARWIAVGEVDGHEGVDVVVNGGSTDTTKLIANPTAASFAAHTPLATAVPAPTSTPAPFSDVEGLGLGDLDGDGSPDIVMNSWWGFFVVVQYGDGTGAFPTDKSFFIY